MHDFDQLLLKLQEAQATGQPNAFGNTSELWQGIFDGRSNDTSSESMASFLAADSTRSDGVGIVPLYGRPDKFADYYRPFMTAEAVKAFPQSPIGAPAQIDFDGVQVGPAHLQNLSRILTLQQWTNHFESLEDMHVVEIGAGYGAFASQLMQTGKVASYTIIDLAENIGMSLYYLSQMFPEYEMRIPASTEAIELKAGCIHFVTPGTIAALDNCLFDLAVNTDSFGEMPAEAATAYITWIASHLSERGRCFVKNGHRRSRDAVMRVSDYGYEQLTLERFAPTNIVSALFHDHSHMALFSRADSSQQNEALPAQLDVLAALFAVGLQQELEPLCERVAAGTPTDGDKVFMQDMAQFFAEPSMHQKPSYIGSYDDASFAACGGYLSALCDYMVGQNQQAIEGLLRYLEAPESYAAEAYAVHILLDIAPQKAPKNYAYPARTEFLLQDTHQHIAHPAKRCIFFAIRKDNLRRKLQVAGNYQPSMLMLLKNIAMNLKEGKRLTTPRYSI